MRTTTLRAIIGIVGLVALVQPGRSQGAFTNLGFEAASLSGPPQINVPVGTALPGWSAFVYTPSFGTTVLTTVVYDEISLGGPAISLMDANIAGGLTPLQGRYSVLLFGGGSNPLYSAGVSQGGLVPPTARTLLMDVQTLVPRFGVTLGGQTVSMVALESFSGYTRYGGDITPLAGQVWTLTISQPPALGTQPSELELDNIQFSDVVIPEPGVLGLLALGTLFVAGRRDRQR